MAGVRMSKKYLVVTLVLMVLSTTIYLSADSITSENIEWITKSTGLSSLTKIHDSTKGNEPSKPKAPDSTSLEGYDKVTKYSDKILFSLFTFTQILLKDWVSEFLTRSEYDRNLDTSILQAAKTDSRLQFYFILDDIQKFLKGFKHYKYVEGAHSYKFQMAWSDLVFNYSPYLNYFEHEDFTSYREAINHFINSGEIYRAPLVTNSENGQLNNITCDLFVQLIAQSNNVSFESVIDESSCQSINEDISDNFYSTLDDSWFASLYWISKRIDVKFPGNPLTYYNSLSMDYIKIVSYTYLLSTMPAPSNVFILDRDMGSFKLVVTDDADKSHYHSYFFDKSKQRALGLMSDVFPDKLHDAFEGIVPKTELKKLKSSLKDPKLIARLSELQTDIQFAPPSAMGLSSKKIDVSEFVYKREDVKTNFAGDAEMLSQIDFQLSILDDYVPLEEGLKYEDLSFQELDLLNLKTTDKYLQRQRYKVGHPDIYLPQYFQEVIINYHHLNFDWRFCRGPVEDFEQMAFINNRLLSAWFRFAEQIEFDTWISDEVTLSNWAEHGVLNHNTSTHPVAVEISFESLIKIIQGDFNQTIIYDATLEESKISESSFLDVGSTGYLLDINPYFMVRSEKMVSWQNMNDIRLIDLRTGIFINVNALVQTPTDENGLVPLPDTNLDLLDDAKLMKLRDPSSAEVIDSIMEKCVSEGFAVSYNAGRDDFESTNDITVDCDAATNEILPKYKDLLVSFFEEKRSLLNDKGNRFELLTKSSFIIYPVILDGVKVYVPNTFDNKIQNMKPNSLKQIGLNTEVYNEFKLHHEQQLNNVRNAIESGESYTLEAQEITNFRVDPFIRDITK